MKLKRKFSTANKFIGTAHGKTITATGRTKREATKRLRLLFAAQGVPTSSALLDHLVVSAAARAGEEMYVEPKAAQGIKVKTMRATNRRAKAAEIL